MADKKSVPASQDSDEAIDNLRRHLEALDQRLDNIDSMVSAVAERVMNQPIVLNLTCPMCGKRIEVTLIGTEKPGA